MEKKTILVTGGAGFIGSHLCRRLHDEGHRVISLDNYFTGTRENHVPGVEYREGHTKYIEDLVPESPDLVYHLGEYSRVEKSFEDVEQVFALNSIGTFAVLEFVRRRGAKIVYAGSSTKFGDGGRGRDQSPYAWSKANNTELVKNYAEWFGIQYAITYFYNVYGPGERAGAFGTVIEIFRQNRLAGKPLGVVAPGTQIRNFTHVDDIVDGLVLVGEKGTGDEFGLGNDTGYSILEVAKMVGGEIVMLPERKGNRMQAGVHTERSRALGWKPQRSLAAYIDSMEKKKAETVAEKRILVFTTTFQPISGPAEDALCMLMEKLPDVTFDIVTACHTQEALQVPCALPNGVVHRIGFGTPFDKYLLPILGKRKAFELAEKHRYIFAWSLMASYGALPALAVRRHKNIPLLVTLADQDISLRERLLLRLVLRETDQVYSSIPEQGHVLPSLERRIKARRSLGEGDAFANQIRFAYSAILQNLLTRKR